MHWSWWTTPSPPRSTRTHCGAESLVTQPITTTHHGLDPADRACRGIADSMVRVSVGLEDAEDLIADLAQALNV
ncbi:PLP-dependent transferase [Kibdelosporangium philippinense]|uniref:PLP-dependent transferase n=1 Tax=Kibdelosporangium philippinense TaxID=211113 RepID=A0ABS8Z9U2_9PSEU|nr:PLP-dependent transferase [Kibdelosporangium philippinense]MCE7004595.1 PLP-dependent transferase [Kibdelosporangium philippinense]